ncbi:MAG: sigma-70 family RNA polymerase sigma factor [Kiritimatiellae bacterium]|nr:sigma-70 family RNA polymerase sigma factor [Kiritimatiellia bacterium]
MGKKPKQLKAEKRKAFETLVREYEKPLLRYAVRLLRDQDAAQDVVQNTFLRFLSGWKEAWLPSPQLSSWLYRVAHNCAVDYIRKESRRRALHEKQSKEIPVAVDPDRGEAFRVSDEAAQAADALGTLSARDQQLVILKIYEEKSYKEISAIAGLTVTNVGYILHHAMKKLAVELTRLKETPNDGPTS